MWQQWGQRNKGVRRRVHDMGQRQIENVSPESRLLTGVKRGTKQLTVYHPSSISDEVINQQLAAIAASQGKAEYWKLSAAVAALPVAFAVDTLIIIGLPPMLTGYTGKHLLADVQQQSSHVSTYMHLRCGVGTMEPWSMLHQYQQHVSALHLTRQSCAFATSKAGAVWAEMLSPALQSLGVAAGYLSYKHYKGAAGASTLKKLGQASTPQQPLSAGLPNLQQQQQHPPTDPSSEQAYTGFAPQFPESVSQAQQVPGQADYPTKSGTYSAVPSDSNPMSYETMLDSLPPSGSAGQGSTYNPVQYPSIESRGPAGQYPTSSSGVAPTSPGLHPGTSWFSSRPNFSTAHIAKLP